MKKKKEELVVDQASEGSVEVQEKKIKKIINIVFGVLLGLLVLVTVDVLCVAKFNVGPFLAIRTNVYKDGGTKVYYGLGYKVIKYDQTEGRKGTKIGFWNLNYIVEPTPVDVLDLAIAYRNDAKKTYKKYYGQYLKLSGAVSSVDNQKKILTIRYTDPDGKYTLDVVGQMFDSKIDLSTYQVGQVVSFVGTVSGYKNKTDQIPNQILVSDCFIKS